MMSSADQGTIVSLTYHEITEDPRVLKEARALAQAGYDVHIFCDWPEGKPRHDVIDGIRITRFKCFGYEGATRKAFEEMTFLDRSREEIRQRYMPFAIAAEHVARIGPDLKAKFGGDVFDRLRTRHFREHSGLKRYRRLLSYLYLHLRMQFYSVPKDLVDASNVKGRPIRPRAATRAYRQHRRHLFLAESIPFWANFPGLPPGERAAAIHAHDIYCLPAGVMLSKRTGAPLVYDAHEYEPARATKLDAGVTQLPELLEDDCFPQVSRIITVSQGIGELYAARFKGPAPTIVMNAPEIDASVAGSRPPVRPGLRTVREQAGLAPDVPLVVFTGGIQRSHRGCDKVLEALVLLPAVHLVSLGPRNASNDDWFTGLAKELGVSERVRLLPPVDARDVPAAISDADVSVCPFQDVSLNHRLAMPNKLFEAAFAHVPICVSDLPEMRRFVETLGIGRTMDQTDPSDIAAALGDVIGNRERYAATPDAALKLIEFYSWQRQAEKLLELYRDLVGQPRSAAAPENGESLRARA